MLEEKRGHGTEERFMPLDDGMEHWVDRYVIEPVEAAAKHGGWFNRISEQGKNYTSNLYDYISTAAYWLCQTAVVVVDNIHTEVWRTGYHDPLIGPFPQEIAMETLRNNRGQAEEGNITLTLQITGDEESLNELP